MGWKSSIDITRAEAITAIRASMPDELERLSSKELEELMYELNIGDDLDKPYFGYNYNITDE